jgi:hypothetical protein
VATPRVGNIASSANIVIASNLYDQYNVTALAVGTNIDPPTGVPADGQRMVLRILDNGNAQVISWTTTSTGWRPIGLVLPTTTIASNYLYVGAVYNSANSFWDVVAIAQDY